MSKNYNSTLQSNNADLQAILTTINELPNAGGGDPVLQDKTVTPTTSQQTVTADSNYDGLSKVIVNAMPTATQATPSISVSSAGLITASSTQSAGYVASGTKSATKQLTTQAAQTITPGTSNKTISSGRYLTGTQTIKGDSNLIASNIKSGVSIFGVSGSYGGGSTSGGFPNGTAWEAVNNNALSAVLYQNGLWVGGGTSGLCYSTDNGKTWVSSNVTYGKMVEIKYSNGVWVAGSTLNTRGVYYSSDGKYWFKSLDVMVKHISTNNQGTWILIDFNYNLYISTDNGKSWAAASNTNFSEISSSPSEPVYGNGVWVISHNSGIHYSIDGVTWNASNVSDRISPRDVVFDSGMFITRRLNSLYYSSDGQTWTKANIPSGNYARYARCGAKILAADIENKKIYYSTNWKNWTELGSAEVATSGLNFFKYANGIYLCGISGSTRNGLYYSYDGAAWISANVSSAIGFAEYADGVWIATGGMRSVAWEPTT